MILLPPVVQEVFPDVTSLDDTIGDLFTIRCDGLMQLAGTFPPRTLDINFGALNETSPFPLWDGITFPVSKGQTYRLREVATSSGTLIVSVWPGDPADLAAIAVLASSSVAAAGSSDLLEVLEDIQDRQGALGTDYVFAVGRSAADTDDTVDIAAVANTIIVVTSIHVTFGLGSALNDSLIELFDDGATGTAVWEDVIGTGESAGTPHQTPPGFAIPMDVGAIARVAVPAVGALIVSHTSLSGFRIPA